MGALLLAVGVFWLVFGTALVTNARGAADRVAALRLYERGLSTKKGARTRGEARFVGAVALVVGAGFILGGITNL